MDLARFFANFVLVPNVLAAIIGIPSAMLYLFEVGIIMACRNQHQFNSSFFHLVMVRALPSILNMFSSYFGLRFGLLGLFYPLYEWMPGWLFNFFLFVSYYTYHVENLSTTLLLFNRFTSIMFAFSYEKIWQKWILLADLLIFAIPFTVSWPILFAPNDGFHFLDATNTTFGLIMQESEDPCTLYVAYSGAAFLVICFCLNLASWLAYRRKYKHFYAKREEACSTEKGDNIDKSSSNNCEAVNSGLGKIESHLFLYAFWTFICQLVMAALYYSIYLSTLPTNDESRRVRIFVVDLLHHNFGFINDVCTVAIPAWLLLFTCSKMREIIRAQMRMLGERLTKTTIRPLSKALVGGSGKKDANVEGGGGKGGNGGNGGCSRIDGRLYCKNNFV